MRTIEEVLVEFRIRIDYLKTDSDKYNLGRKIIFLYKWLKKDKRIFDYLTEIIEDDNGWVRLKRIEKKIRIGSSAYIAALKNAYSEIIIKNKMIQYDIERLEAELKFFGIDTPGRDYDLILKTYLQKWTKYGIHEILEVPQMEFPILSDLDSLNRKYIEERTKYMHFSLYGYVAMFNLIERAYDKNPIKFITQLHEESVKPRIDEYPIDETQLLQNLILLSNSLIDFCVFEYKEEVLDVGINSQNIADSIKITFDSDILDFEEIGKVKFDSSRSIHKDSIPKTHRIINAILSAPKKEVSYEIIEQEGVERRQIISYITSINSTLRKAYDVSRQLKKPVFIEHVKNKSTKDVRLVILGD